MELEEIVLASGCFWCIEAIYQRLGGVVCVEVGYANGDGENSPSYKEVIEGHRNFAEVAKIVFNPEILSYEKLLGIFWRSHDPTSLNSQGMDIGVQYRSGIFFQSGQQEKLAKDSCSVAQRLFSKPIVTEIVPLKNYFRAEDYHQKYFNNNRDHRYCTIVIHPKLEKLELLGDE